jgi:hypothetical protein
MATAHHPSRWALIGVEALIGVNAVYGGVGLIRDGMGMPAEWLDSTPFGSWVIPGILLLAVIGVPMVTAATAELLRWRWAYLASLIAAVFQLGWIVAQVLTLQRYFFLQPVLFVAGLLVGGLAIWSHRGERLPVLSPRIGSGRG